MRRVARGAITLGSLVASVAFALRVSEPAGVIAVVGGFATGSSLLLLLYGAGRVKTTDRPPPWREVYARAGARWGAPIGAGIGVFLASLSAAIATTAIDALVAGLWAAFAGFSAVLWLATGGRPARIE